MSTTKITNQTLSKIIKEEYKKLLSESIVQFSKTFAAAAGKITAKSFANAIDLAAYIKGAKFKKIIQDALESSDEFAKFVKGMSKSADFADAAGFFGDSIASRAKRGKMVVEALKDSGKITSERAAEMLASSGAGGILEQIGDAATTAMKEVAPIAARNAGKVSADVVAPAAKMDPLQIKALGVVGVAAVAATAALTGDQSTLNKATAAANALPGPVPATFPNPNNMTMPQQVQAAQNILASLPAGTTGALASIGNALGNAIQQAGGTVAPANQGAGAAAGGAKGRRTALAHKTINNSGGPAESVKQFQNRLIKLGYSVGNLGADGDYGGGTVGGVKKFQEKNGLLNKQGQPDGIVGPNTWGKMSAEGAISASGAEAETADTGGGTTEDPAIAKTRALQNNPARAVRVYQYAYNQLSREKSNRETRKVLPRLGSDQGGYKLKGKVYSTDSKNLSAATMGFLAALISKKTEASKLLKIEPEKLMQIVNMALNLPGNQKADKEDPGSTIDPSALTGYAPRDVTGASLDDPNAFKLQETKSYNLNFDKWSKLWK